jgi:membrane-bound inhibitor of C-type lysozyme
MKCQDFSSILRAFSDVLAAAGAQVAQDHIIVFAAAFDAHPMSSVSDLAKRIVAAPVTESTGSTSLGDVARLLSALRGFLNKTAKSTVLTDVNTIEKLSQDRASMEIRAIALLTTAAAGSRRSTRKRDAPAVRDDLVVQYKQKLEAALGDEEKFTAIYNDLRANTAMGKPEMTALAKQMTGSGARTQDAALKKIWNTRLTTAAAGSRRSTGKREAPGLRDDLVVQYKQKLEAALGDEEKFTAIYNDLRANPAMGKPEMTALAKQMTGSGARTQDAALKKIWNRHQSLMLFKAKSRATGGRSAA